MINPTIQRTALSVFPILHFMIVPPLLKGCRKMVAKGLPFGDEA